MVTQESVRNRKGAGAVGAREVSRRKAMNKRSSLAGRASNERQHNEQRINDDRNGVWVARNRWVNAVVENEAGCVLYHALLKAGASLAVGHSNPKH